MYRFPDPDDRLTLNRRDLLDWYGFIAHVSVLMPLTGIYCGHVFSRLHRKTLAKRIAQIAKFGFTPDSTWQRRLIWWCCESFEIGGCHLETRGILLGAIAWTAWLLALTFFETGEDYIHLSGRFGIIAASQLPLHYLLSLKTSHSPIQVVARTCAESLIPVHKQLGYIIMLFSCMHSALYINFFVQTRILLGKFTQLYILCGSFGMVAFTVIVFTALKPVRDWSYRIFYISHTLLSIVAIPVLYLHGQHMRIYLWEALAIYLVNRLLRIWARTTYMGTIRKIDDSDLIEIKISLTSMITKKSYIWQPGQYAYVSIAGSPLLEMFRNNPFTIASVAATDGEMRFIARVLAGNTARILRFRGFEGAVKLSVEGPYGHASRQQALFKSDRVLFVAGGIGGTFISPLYRQILHRNQDSGQAGRIIPSHFVWIARSMADISWAFPESDEENVNYVTNLQIHLTRNFPAGSSGAEHNTADGRENRNSMTSGEIDKDVHSDEQQELLVPSGMSESSSICGLCVVAGRPDLARLVERLFSYSTTERVAVVICGPPQLARSLRKETSDWITTKGRDCFWWAETFGR